MLNDYSVSLTVFPLVVVGLILSLIVFARNWRFALQVQVEEDVAALESEEEKRKRKESISNGLNVKEWVLEDPPAESAEGEPQINSSPASCAKGGEDCDPLAREEETAGCAICLGQFKPQQLVCESNNSSCQHVFHKDCMVDWLMKNHDNCSTCPICRAKYLVETV
jgi:hypothetical protein